MTNTSGTAVDICAMAEVAAKLLKTRQAAEYLSCSEWALRKLVQDDRIPRVLFGEGGVWRFDISDLDRFIEAHRLTGS